MYNILSWTACKIYINYLSTDCTSTQPLPSTLNCTVLGTAGSLQNRELTRIISTISPFLPTFKIIFWVKSTNILCLNSILWLKIYRQKRIITWNHIYDLLLKGGQKEATDFSCKNFFYYIFIKCNIWYLNMWPPLWLKCCIRPWMIYLTVCSTTALFCSRFSSSSLDSLPNTFMGDNQVNTIQ